MDGPKEKEQKSISSPLFPAAMKEMLSYTTGLRVITQAAMHQNFGTEKNKTFSI